MEYVKIAAVADIPPGKMKSFKAAGADVLVVNVDGSFHAIGNKCPHAHFPLSMGKVQGCVVTCPLHQARFNVESGANIEDAKILFFKTKPKDAKCYPVKVENENIFVGVADTRAH